MFQRTRPRLYCVDAFTASPFSGNPAGVCILDERRDSGWMQGVARELNLPETAFLTLSGEGYRLQWFTPKAEVDLCGHATLAAAHILWEKGYRQPEFPIRFSTKSGPLTAKKTRRFIWLDFPSLPPQESSAPADLTEALSVTPLYVGKNRFDFIIEVPSEDIVRKIQPDFEKLARVPMRGVIVTSRAERPEHDFVSRFFAPGLGVNEDPVTGSAHCCLAPYWGKKLDKAEMIAYQASERGGTVRLRQVENRVLLGGQAVTIWEGALEI